MTRFKDIKGKMPYRRGRDISISRKNHGYAGNHTHPLWFIVVVTT